MDSNPKGRSLMLCRQSWLCAPASRIVESDRVGCLRASRLYLPGGGGNSLIVVPEMSRFSPSTPTINQHLASIDTRMSSSGKSSNGVPTKSPHRIMRRATPLRPSNGALHDSKAEASTEGPGGPGDPLATCGPVNPCGSLGPEGPSGTSNGTEPVGSGSRILHAPRKAEPGWRCRSEY